MSDVELNITNEGENGTEIQAQPNFGNNDYVFQAEARTAGGNRGIKGLVGIGLNGAVGVEGQSQEGEGVRGLGGKKGGAGLLGEGGERAGTGVHGRGGSPPLVSQITDEEGVAGTGVICKGGPLRTPQDPADPKRGTRIAGLGVIGLASTAKEPSHRDTAACGIFGIGAPAIDSPGLKISGTGVFGQAGEKLPNTNAANNGTGVIGVSGKLNYGDLETAEKGVLGVSENGTGVPRS